MNTETYAEIIHSRMCHVQNLTSALCGLEITGFGALLLQKDYLTGVVQTNLTILVITYGIIFWMHLFSVYQYYSIKKAAFVLAKLEDDIQNYTGIKYFNTGNLRFRLYYICLLYTSPSPRD